MGPKEPSTNLPQYPEPLIVMGPEEPPTNLSTQTTTTQIVQGPDDPTTNHLLQSLALTWKTGGRTIN